MGKGAPLCLNGALTRYIGTVEPGKLSQLVLWKIHKVGKFLKEGAHSCLNRALTLKLVPLGTAEPGQPHFSHREKKKIKKQCPSRDKRCIFCRI